jgi:hypothetical protein
MVFPSFLRDAAERGMFYSPEVQGWMERLYYPL